MVRAMRRTLLLSALVFVACKTGPAELSPEPVDTSNTTTTAVATANTNTPPNTPPSTPPRERLEAPPPQGKGGPDPLDGKFTIADATKDLPGKGPLVAKIETSKGTLQCKLLDD